MGNENESNPNSTVQSGQSDAPDWYKNPPSWYNQSPSNSRPTSQERHQDSSNNSGSADLLTAIQGLPERIVNGLREATQSTTPPPAQTEQKSEEKTEEKKEDPKEPGTKRGGFTGWWFGE